MSPDASDRCKPTVIALCLEADNVISPILTYRIANLIIDHMIMQMLSKASSDVHLCN